MNQKNYYHSSHRKDARAESALKHVPEFTVIEQKKTIKKLTEYLRTMVYYHHHPDRKNWDLIGEAEELVKVIEKGIYEDEGNEKI